MDIFIYIVGISIWVCSLPLTLSVMIDMDKCFDFEKAIYYSDEGENGRYN